MKDLSNDNILHIKKNNIEYLQFRRFLEYKETLIHCCYTLSTHNINFNIDTKYNKDLLDNYKKLARALNFNYKNIVTAYQEHTDIIKNFDKSNLTQTQDITTYKNIDGLITNIPKAALIMRFADCTPILLFDPVKKVISNLHSGWRGTIKQIARKGVRKLVKEYGSNPKNILCGIGPGIKQCHFETDEQVKNIFKQEFGYMDKIEQIIKKGRKINGKQKYNIDTEAINKNILQEEGIPHENIITSGICTVCNNDLMYSYRANKNQEGRNCSVMCLCPIGDVS